MPSLIVSDATSNATSNSNEYQMIIHGKMDIINPFVSFRRTAPLSQLGLKQISCPNRYCKGSIAMTRKDTKVEISRNLSTFTSPNQFKVTCVDCNCVVWIKIMTAA